MATEDPQESRRRLEIVSTVRSPETPIISLCSGEEGHDWLMLKQLNLILNTLQWVVTYMSCVCDQVQNWIKQSKPFLKLFKGSKSPMNCGNQIKNVWLQLTFDLWSRALEGTTKWSSTLFCQSKILIQVTQVTYNLVVDVAQKKKKKT